MPTNSSAVENFTPIDISTSGRSTETETPYARRRFELATDDSASPQTTVLKTDVRWSPGQTQLAAAPIAALRDIQRVKTLSAVVSEATEDSVALKVFMPDREIVIRVAKSLVPESSQSFGSPVSLTLDTAEGHRRLLIEQRTVKQNKTSPAIAELSKWVEQL